MANCRLTACRTGSPSSAGQHGLVLAAEHDQDIVEARVADLPDGAPDERLAAKRQEELLPPHPRRGACGEHDCTDHGEVV